MFPMRCIEVLGTRVWPEAALASKFFSSSSKRRSMSMNLRSYVWLSKRP